MYQHSVQLYMKLFKNACCGAALRWQLTMVAGIQSDKGDGASDRASGKHLRQGAMSCEKQGQAQRRGRRKPPAKF